jgi:phosphoenolpyruvate carboxylase
MMPGECAPEFEMLRADLGGLWDSCLDRARSDPFTNPYLLFSLDVSRRLDARALDLDGLGAIIGALAGEGFLARAERLRAYLDAPDADRDAAGVRTVFEHLADGGFEAFAAALERPRCGVVTTAHPTFALAEDACLALVELATRQSAAGEPLDDDACEARAAWAARTALGPPSGLTLDVEHAWSVRALHHARDALEEARRIALDVGRARWPQRWTELRPNLLTLATWVGFDQDGRTDVTWRVSIGKRLELKAEALQRLSRRARHVAPTLSPRLDEALKTVELQLLSLETAAQGHAQTAAFARTMVEGRAASLADPTLLFEALEAALASAEDDQTRAELVLLRADIQTYGVCLADIHVRLNAAQLHNAVRREVGLETSPADPANRRAYFAAINRLIEDCHPVEVGFQSLLEEPTSAKRLFITLAQMKKFIDARSRVRFLIAETESGFTLLAALYFARLFGVEDVVEISPLFETEEALARGEAVIEEALRSSHFRDYLRRQGRLCIEFGFSDSGRFVGQMAATFRIERLRLRLAELVEREGLVDLEVVLFNTHGESIGRGGHPTSLQDRLSYCAPPQNRWAFAKRGIGVREEDSFQGGDGYLAFFTPPAARATVRGLLQFAYEAPAETLDPIYDRADFASDFFASIQQSFKSLAKDRDYPALLSLFGTRFLNRTGSRPDQRQAEDRGQVRTFKNVAELRAIPNNAILQGLGHLTNTIFGIARAAEKDPTTFAAMATQSARFRQALDMATAAASLSDLPAMRAYAATVNPSLWLDRRAGAPAAEAALLPSLTQLAERADMTSALSRTLRRIRSDPGFPLPIQQNARRDRLRLLHALRIALLQRIALLAARVPAFTPYDSVTREDVQLQLIRLDVTAAVETLRSRFPAHQTIQEDHADFGEQPTYEPSVASGYAKERAELFEPLLSLHALILKTTTALDLEIGACG